ncbi:MAG: ribose 1,5-bisphosphate isomerase, partial [Candidatus Ranarchaeia archaeon]
MIPDSVKSIANDIRLMKIRGAGLIARTACRGLLETAKQSRAKTADSFYNEMLTVARYLNKTRPSAVSLPNGLRFVLKRLKSAYELGRDVDVLKKIVIDSASTFIKNSELAVKRIGQIGARRIRDGDVLMTICNSTAAI